MGRRMNTMDDGWMVACMHRWISGWMNGWMDGQMNGSVDGLINGWIDEPNEVEGAYRQLGVKLLFISNLGARMK